MKERKKENFKYIFVIIFFLHLHFQIRTDILFMETISTSAKIVKVNDDKKI